MDIQCPQCKTAADMVGHEDARAYYECPVCKRVWASMLRSPLERQGPRTARESVRILVVDDSNSLVGLLEAWLEEEGYSVVSAVSGRQALEAAAVYSPDIVLLDLILPPPDGFTVCRALRSVRQPQIILMTGLSEPNHVRRALDLGVVALLRKPLTQEAVIGAVAIAAERAKLRGAAAPGRADLSG